MATLMLTTLLFILCVELGDLISARESRRRAVREADVAAHLANLAKLSAAARRK